MNNARLSILIAAFFLAAAGPVHAASSEWAKVEGGAVRVLVSANPDDDGRLRGALQVQLEPGWKTYWLDPGDAGVPPSVSMGVGGTPGKVEIGFPPPERHDDGYAVWAGYGQSVSLALTITPPSATGTMEFSVFLGVCETICIPFQSTFSVEPDRNVANSEHEAIVDEAFAALPRPARPGFRVLSARVEGESVLVEAEAPAGDAPADIFLASTENRMFGTPRKDGRSVFRVPILSAATDAAVATQYTLVSGGEAVSGTITVGE